MTEVESKTAEKTDTASDPAPIATATSADTSDDTQSRPKPTEEKSAGEVNGNLEKDSILPTLEETKTNSDRVQEAKEYNNRDRTKDRDRNLSKTDRPPEKRPYQKRDYSRNVKSDFTSQAESSDPVEIRKQVPSSSI